VYHHLRGTVTQVRPARVVIEAGGVGYDVVVPLSVSRRIPEAGQPVVLLTHLVVKDDALQLVGFLADEERELFRRLIGVSGIGPTTALQILSAATPKEFLIAVERQDAAFFKRIKGIGEKTAKRLILELKGAKMVLSDGGGDATAPNSIAVDAQQALSALGVPPAEAAARVEKALAGDPGLSLEDLIKAALR